jgi:hypothetical protein
VCAWRGFAAEYAAALRPDAAALAADALQLSVLCNATAPTPARARARRAAPSAVAASEVYIDGVRGNDGAAGTLAAPLRSLAAGVARARTLPRPATVFVRSATYRLSETLELCAADSGLTIAAFEGEAAWVSGTVPLGALVWAPSRIANASLEVFHDVSANGHCDRSDAAAYPCGCAPAATLAACEAAVITEARATGWSWHGSGGVWAGLCCVRRDGAWAPKPEEGFTSGRRTPAANVWRAPVPMAALAATGGVMPELRVNGARATRARFPNADPERDLFPTGWVTGGGTRWAPPKPSPPIAPVLVSNAAIALRNSTQNVAYSGALGGPCHVFDPPFSYWCAAKPAGGGGFQYYVPGGAMLENGTAPPFPTPAGNLPIFQVWRAAHWANWMFEIEAWEPSTQTVAFGKGGFQGARGGPGSEYFLENALEFLDAPGEYYYDAAGETLFYFNNATGAPALDTVFEVPALATLVRVNASQAAPAVGISLVGLGFKDTAPTYLAPHAVPSGGDWALERTAAVFAEGTTGLVVRGCNFSRVGGNALMLSGFARGAVLEGNAFRWTGGSAMVAWGRTDEVSAGGTLGWDATAGDFPDGTLVRGNLASEIGVWAKQNSCFAAFKAARTTLEGNLCFNVARAGFNFNDGLGGGDEVHDNLIFNTNRESADHGPISERS